MGQARQRGNREQRVEQAIRRQILADMERVVAKPTRSPKLSRKTLMMAALIGGLGNV